MLAPAPAQRPSPCEEIRWPIAARQTMRRRRRQRPPLKTLRGWEYRDASGDSPGNSAALPAPVSGHGCARQEGAFNRRWCVPPAGPGRPITKAGEQMAGGISISCSRCRERASGAWTAYWIWRIRLPVRIGSRLGSNGQLHPVKRNGNQAGEYEVRFTWTNSSGAAGASSPPSRLVSRIDDADEHFHLPRSLPAGLFPPGRKTHQLANRFDKPVTRSGRYECHRSDDQNARQWQSSRRACPQVLPSGSVACRLPHPRNSETGTLSNEDIKEMNAPAMTPGRIRGNTIRRKVYQRLAPRMAELSSRVGSSWASAATVLRTT